MLRRILIAPTVLLVALGLASCAVEPASAPAATNVPTATPAVVTTPFTCDEIVSVDDVAKALTGSDALAPEPVPAIKPSTNLEDYAVASVGGLSCSWRVGSPEGNPLSHAESADWAYLSVSILPGAADAWTPYVIGDGPDDTLTEIAGAQAATQCGDPGCVISAPAGDAWMHVGMRTTGFGIGQSPFGDLSTETILGNMQPIAASVITAIAGAEDGQLAWPASPVGGDATCEGTLSVQAAAVALGVDEVSYAVSGAVPAERVYFDDAVASVGGFFDCTLQATDATEVIDTAITVGPGHSSVVDLIVSQPDTSTALAQVQLVGAVEGARAVEFCAETSGFCSVIFSQGDSVYQVQSRIDAIAIAEAIIAQAR